MYTQCPECQIAFRVTAKVLQQAGGNVRCGGCGHAFNALHHLSEEMPEQSTAPKSSEAADDELAETSRRLLETLDELAGPDDVRIEDTGVEWRVLDEAASADAVEPILTEAKHDQLRFDDNTPLPDDFDGAEDSYTPPAPPQRRDADQITRASELEDRQGDLALSEPEDWTDLLDEVRDSEAESFGVEEELAAIHTELSSREEKLETDFVPGDLDSQFETQAEAMGIDITGARKAVVEDGLTDEVLQLDQNEIEAADSEEADEETDEELESGIKKLLSAEIGEDEDDGEDTDGSGVFTDDEETTANRESTGEFEAHIDTAARALTGEESEDDEIDDENLDEENLDEEIDDDALELADDSLELDDAEDDEVRSDAETEHEVQEPTAEEMTVNMEIDEQLLAAADTDKDFTATLVGIDNPEHLFDENSGEVETIIMEGEFIRSAIEEERHTAKKAAKSQLDDPARLADTYALRRDKLRGGRRRYDPPTLGMVAAVALLAMLLGAQFVHNSRESLATFGLFNQTIGPVYRVLGHPVTPEWDIKGWQFEATNGSVGNDETSLTIVSRIGNNSDQPLPYPLVHVSLTNRFEDIMGSRILEPGEYLAGDLDPSKPVAPDENFTAVIKIEEPSPDATGFKLNVCYRVQPGTVRCAIEDFKN